MKIIPLLFPKTDSLVVVSKRKVWMNLTIANSSSSFGYLVFNYYYKLLYKPGAPKFVQSRIKTRGEKVWIAFWAY